MAKLWPIGAYIPFKKTLLEISDKINQILVETELEEPLGELSTRAPKLLTYICTQMKSRIIMRHAFRFANI